MSYRLWEILRFIGKCEELDILKCLQYWYFFDNTVHTLSELCKKPEMQHTASYVACQNVLAYLSPNVVAYHRELPEIIPTEKGVWIHDQLMLLSDSEFFSFSPEVYLFHTKHYKNPF